MLIRPGADLDFCWSLASSWTKSWIIGCLPAGAAGAGEIWTAAVGDGPLPGDEGAGAGVVGSWTAAVGDGPLPGDEIWALEPGAGPGFLIAAGPARPMGGRPGGAEPGAAPELLIPVGPDGPPLGGPGGSGGADPDTCTVAVEAGVFGAFGGVAINDGGAYAAYWTSFYSVATNAGAGAGAGAGWGAGAATGGAYTTAAATGAGAGAGAGATGYGFATVSYYKFAGVAYYATPGY